MISNIDKIKTILLLRGYNKEEIAKVIERYTIGLIGCYFKKDSKHCIIRLDCYNYAFCKICKQIHRNEGYTK